MCIICSAPLPQGYNNSLQCGRHAAFQPTAACTIPDFTAFFLTYAGIWVDLCQHNCFMTISKINLCNNMLQSPSKRIDGSIPPKSVHTGADHSPFMSSVCMIILPMPSIAQSHKNAPYSNELSVPIHRRNP